MTALIGAAAVAAFAGAPHCALMCGPLVAAAGPHPVAWHVGRITMYTLIGAIAGTVGRILPGPPGVAIAASLALVVLSTLQLGGWLPAWSPKLPWVGRFAGALRSGGAARGLGLGALSAMLPCGLLWSVLPLALSSGNAAGGSVVMLTLGLCSVPALALISVVERRFFSWGARPRQFAALAVLVLGVWSVGTRTDWGNADPEAAPSCHKPG